MTFTIKETPDIKMLRSENYNYKFNKRTGFFARWGRTILEDPECCPFGPEIADIEISTVCSQGCKFCYKSNTPHGHNMDIKMFKSIFDKLPKTVTQIAFGIGDIGANKDLEAIFQCTRDNGVIPNLTINGYGMTPAYYDMLAKYCGAVAVSYYDKDTCYTALRELHDRGLEQTNIHCLLSRETMADCIAIVDDYMADPEFAKVLNAVVFLMVKPKGRAVGKFTLPSVIEYKALVDKAIANGVPIGFDSCGAPHFLEFAERGMEFKQYVDPCESTLFSVYIDVHGVAYPCSFSTNCYPGTSIVQSPDVPVPAEYIVDDFVEGVWHGEIFNRFRKDLLENKDKNGCRMCPCYDLRIK